MSKVSAHYMVGRALSSVGRASRLHRANSHEMHGNRTIQNGTERDSMANEAAVADHLRTTDDEDEGARPWMVPPQGSGYFVFSGDRFAEYLDAVGYSPDGRQGVPPTFPKHAKPLTDREWQRLQSLGMARWTYFARGKITGRIKIGQSSPPRPSKPHDPTHC